ncbi:hypothetical protein T03_3964 [Trichinella britovi]|uniref:Uncharacterized protein n=1 Tax=Trichinella britovi TaxID=45882 RepID=A0A0V1CKS5_TRIBR|nr:hypothetical protein T03_3964 [Trichinella britovi]
MSHVRKLAATAAVGKCLEINKKLQISKTKFSPIFAKTTKSIAHEICNFRETSWNPKKSFRTFNRSEMI